MCLYGISNFEQISHLIISRSDNGEVRVYSDFVSAVSKLPAAHLPSDGSEAECIDVVLRNLQGSDVANSRGLGDMVSSALSSVGITKERVSAAVGRPCGCAERQEALNDIGRRFGIG